MALRRAAESGNVEKLKDLLSRKVNVHERERYGGYTALHYAANAAVARLLLEAHADPEERSYAGTTPLQLAQRRGNADLVRVLREAEVEDGVRASRLEVKRQAAADELARAFISRAVSDMVSLETSQPEVMSELRRDDRLRTLLMQASAVQEMEVLVGLKPAAGQRPHAELVRALQEDNREQVQSVLHVGAVDLLQRDPHGNVPAHECKSIDCYRLVIAKEPRAEEVRNKDGQTPFEVLFRRNPSMERLKELWCGGPPPAPGGDGADKAPFSPDAAKLLRLDGTGVSLCMRAEGKGKEWILEQISPWEEFQKYFKMPESLPGCLKRVVPQGRWEEVLSLHLFAEPDVWRDGKMTALCALRLEEVWACMKLLFQKVLKRNPVAEALQAMEALDRLLAATQGPHRLLDPREPYRKELNLEMFQLALQSETIHNIIYEMMAGPAASWLKGFIDEKTWEKVDPFGRIKSDVVQHHRDKQKLRTTFQFAEGGRHLAAPSWARANIEFDLRRVVDDLRHIGGKDLSGCLGEETFGNSDAVYRMLEGRHGFGPGAFPSQLSAFCEPLTMYWYCLWMRGLCQGRQEKLVNGISAILRRLEPQRVSDAEATSAASGAGTGPLLIARSDAFSLGGFCRRVLQEMHEIYNEIREHLVPDVPGAADPRKEELARHLMAAAPSFVLSANPVTVIVEDAEHIVEVFNLLKHSHGGVVQVRNSFNRKARLGGECRRLEVWVPIKTDHGPLVAEVTLLLADDYVENSWHRLPLEYFRGAFDRHVHPERPTEDALEKYTKVKFSLNPALIPESKSKADHSDIDEETARMMRELAERRAREAERIAVEEARKKREELERKLKEASADFDPADCVVVGALTFRPPIEVLPKTKRNEALEMKKLEKFNAKKAANSAASAAQGANPMTVDDAPEDLAEEDVAALAAEDEEN